MVVYPVFARHGTKVRSSIAAKAAPLIATFVGHLMVTVMLAALIGIAFGAIAGLLVVVALV